MVRSAFAWRAGGATRLPWENIRYRCATSRFLQNSGTRPLQSERALPPSSAPVLLIARAPPARCCSRRSVTGAARHRDGSSSDPPGLESPETSELIRELAITTALGSVYNATYPVERWFLIPTACGAVDKGLVAALQDGTRPTAERLQLLALRVYLKAKVWLLVSKAKRDFADSGAEATPVS